MAFARSILRRKALKKAAAGTHVVARTEAVRRSFRFFRYVAAIMSLIACPVVAFAQASIAGSVKDTSGAALPGVTVEAASEALIEKTRSVTTDGAGQYRIENLRPGEYTVTFTLSGFSTVKREGIAVSGTATVSINSEMKVGAVEETVTVSGAAPLVDIQSTTKERVMTSEVINTLPTGRLYSDLGQLVPGMTASGGTVGQAQNVGGSLGDSQASLMIHGSQSTDQRILISGVPVQQGSSGIYTPNVGAMQEVALDTAAVSADLPTGGPRINMIPRDGGNTLGGTAFVSFANASMQGNNFTQRLKDLGLKSGPDEVNKNGDFNPGFGGPLKRDKLWFYASGRVLVANLYPSGIAPNLNANNPNAWTYVADTSKRAENNALWTDGQVRLTWQANPKMKFGGTWDEQTRCSCPYYATATRAPEAGANRRSPKQRVANAEAFLPLTDRVFVENVILHRLERYYTQEPEEVLTRPDMVGVVEQSTGLAYRGGVQGGSPAAGLFTNEVSASYHWRAAVSYVTGAHSLKVGFNDFWGYRYPTQYNYTPLLYRFNNGVPNQITEFATPYGMTFNQDYELGLFAQDKWTLKRLTISGGIRFDATKTSSPSQTLGPSLLFPTRNLSFRETPAANWKDITPRMGVVYDLTGDGKTALRASLNQYLQGQIVCCFLTAATNPISALVLSTTRTWTDNGDFVPDCNLAEPLANGECGRMANTDFGTANTTGATVDPAYASGWGRRLSNWEFSVGAQREILPRVSVDVAYFRRWYANFVVTDNRAVTAANYSTYSIQAPVDSRLPGGGGYTINGLVDLNPDKFGVPAQNFTTLASNYGNQYEHWNGVDLGINAGLGAGVRVQGGFSTGQTMTDNCEIVAKLPSLLVSGSTITPQSYCHLETPWLNDFRMQTIWAVPKVDIQVAANVKSVPGPVLSANYTATNAIIAPSLGRNLSSGATATINVVTPNTMYGERLNQLDLRLSKILRFRGIRSTVGLDLYNALNKDTMLAQNGTFGGSWLAPTQVLVARFAKVSATVDF